MADEHIRHLREVSAGFFNKLSYVFTERVRVFATEEGNCT
jgi:hypothetical protein